MRTEAFRQGRARSPSEPARPNLASDALGQPGRTNPPSSLAVAADASRRKLVFGPSSGLVPYASRLLCILSENNLARRTEAFRQGRARSPSEPARPNLASDAPGQSGRTNPPSSLAVAADASRRKLVFGPSSGLVPYASRLLCILSKITSSDKHRRPNQF
jgi:hypothetical protein